MTNGDVVLGLLALLVAGLVLWAVLRELRDD
jgi:hypothetical protein